MASVLILSFFILPAILFSDVFLWGADHLVYKVFNRGKVPDFSVNTQQECIQIGGTWKRLGMDAREGCQIHSNDGNKSCFSGFQCQTGACEAPVDSGLFGIGICVSVSPHYGCSKSVHFGIRGIGICRD